MGYSVSAVTTRNQRRDTRKGLHFWDFAPRAQLKFEPTNDMEEEPERYSVTSREIAGGNIPQLSPHHPPPPPPWGAMPYAAAGLTTEEGFVAPWLQWEPVCAECHLNHQTYATQLAVQGEVTLAAAQVASERRSLNEDQFKEKTLSLLQRRLPTCLADSFDAPMKWQIHLLYVALATRLFIPTIGGSAEPKAGGEWLDLELSHVVESLKRYLRRRHIRPAVASTAEPELTSLVRELHDILVKRHSKDRRPPKRSQRARSAEDFSAAMHLTQEESQSFEQSAAADTRRKSAYGDVPGYYRHLTEGKWAGDEDVRAAALHKAEKEEEEEATGK